MCRLNSDLFHPDQLVMAQPRRVLVLRLSRKASNTSFTFVAELETRIDCWVSHWNDNPEPFVWTKSATHH
jgi:hypothetical protein